MHLNSFDNNMSLNPCYLFEVAHKRKELKFEGYSMDLLKI